MVSGIESGRFRLFGDIVKGLKMGSVQPIRARIREWITKIMLIQSISGNIKPIWAKLCEGVSK